MSRARRRCVPDSTLAGGDGGSRFRASGLEAVAYAARRIKHDGVPVSIAGGVEFISLVGPNANKSRLRNEWLEQNIPGIYMPMIETADNVAVVTESAARDRTSSPSRASAAPRPPNRPNSSPMRSIAHRSHQAGDRQGHRRDPAKKPFDLTPRRGQPA